MVAFRGEELRGAGDVVAGFTHSCGVDVAAEYVAKQWFGWPDCGCDSRRARLNSLFPIGPYRFPRLTIAIPTRLDWYGFHETWHSLVAAIRLAGLTEHIELLVVDQSPDTEHAANIAGTVRSVAANWQVDPIGHRAVNRGGPIDARYEPWAEVLGTAAGKMACFGKASGEWVLCLDSHVILTDDSVRKLYEFIRSPRNRFSGNLHYGVNLADDHRGYFSHLDIWGPEGQPLIGDDGVFGNWRSDPRAKSAAGKPFDVEGGGGWCFFARRDAFLSVGFHHLMRGFGGEEGFLAERFRRAERRVLCAPFVRGIHRYARLSGDQYFVTVEEKLRNHVIGWCDLGFDLEQLRAVWAGRLPAETVDAVIARTVLEFQQGTVAAPVAAPAAAPAALSEPAAADELYRRNCAIPSDINEHLPLLRSLAETVAHVTEFGTRAGVSLSAFLAAQPAVLVSYDVAAGCACNRLLSLAGSTALDYRHGPEVGNTLTCPVINPTDLLFVDSLHTGEQVYQELTRHAGQVSRFLVFHDVVTFGAVGEGSTEAAPVAGLMSGIDRWRAEHPGEWRDLEFHENNNGLLVLERV
jgi:GT2 family glycosyltransferase